MIPNNPLEADLDHILTHTEGLWEDIRGKRLFITGGTGFFGCWLLESLAWANDKLDLNVSALVLIRNYAEFQKKAPHLAIHPAIRFHLGDIRDFRFPEGEFSHIIHAAATSAVATFNNEAPLVTFDIIVEGTRHILDFAAQCHARKFLLTSSGTVYGKQPPEMTHISEDYCGAPDPADPNSFLGESKRTAELLCGLYSEKYGIETKIARCFSFVGPYLPLNIHYAIGNFIRDVMDDRPIQINGDGAPFRSYLYAADLVIWLWTILCRGASCRPYNVGSEDDLTIAELAHQVARTIKPKAEIHISVNPSTGVPAKRYVPSTQRANTDLHLKQTIDLPEAIIRTFRWNQSESI